MQICVVLTRNQPSTKLAFGGVGGKGNGGGKKLGGGGNGPWDWHQNGDEEQHGRDPGDVSANASAGLQWKGWQDRVQADPSFRDKVLIEQVQQCDYWVPS